MFFFRKKAVKEIQIAQARLRMARSDARDLGNVARLAAENLKAARGRWVAALDKVDAIEREVNEKLAIEQAMHKRKERNHGQVEDEQA